MPGCWWPDAPGSTPRRASLGAAGFHALPEEARIEIVQRAEGAAVGSGAWTFFQKTRSDAFEHYYSDPRSLPGIGFAGPPQPAGYLDHADPPTAACGWLTAAPTSSSSAPGPAEGPPPGPSPSGGSGCCSWRRGPPMCPNPTTGCTGPTGRRRGSPTSSPPPAAQTVAPLQTLDPRFDSLRSWNHVSGRVVPGNQRRSRGYSHVAGLGGSTLHFTGEAHRMHPEAMQMASRFGVAADWPFDYATLEPDYDEIERIVGVAGSADDSARPRSAPYPLPPHPLSYASQKLARGARKLGLRWVANPLAALSRPYDGRPGCNYCAGCLRGCPRRDKGSVDVTFLRRARATGRCEIRTGCTVTSVVAGDDDRVRAVEYTDEAGAGRREPVRAVLVAAGAVETPRLLLLSANAHAPDGLANESGQVGRHFMETLSWYTSALHPEPLGSHRGLPSDSICWDFNAPDAIPGVVGGCRFSPGTAEADLLGPVSHAQRVVKGFGRAHQEELRKALGRVVTVASIGESLPGPRSYVDLDPEAKDAHGRPKARIHSHLEESELRRLEFMARGLPRAGRGQRRRRGVRRGGHLRSLLLDPRLRDVPHGARCRVVGGRRPWSQPPLAQSLRGRRQCVPELGRRRGPRAHHRGPGLAHVPSHRRARKTRGAVTPHPGGLAAT